MKISLNIKYFSLTLTTLLFTACSGIKIEQEVNVLPGDWVMAGGSPLQQNISAYTLNPPLELMWEYNIEGGVGPSGLCIADAVLFVNALQGELFTFDVATGGKIGNVKFLGADASTSPLVLGNDIIVSYAGDNSYSLASYNIKQGKTTWRKNYGYLQTSPVLENNFVYFGSLKGVQYKADASTGEMIWRFETGAPIHSTCAVWEDRLIFGNDKGTIFSLGTADGNEKWRIQTGLPVYSTPMISEGIAYIGTDDSNFCAIVMNDGKILWKSNMKSKMIAGSAPFEQNVIFGCVDGSVYSLNKTDGAVKWKFSTRGTITSSPVISGSFIYVTSFDSYVYCLDAYSGSMLWNRKLENKIRTSPLVWKDYLFVAADDIVYCFTNKPVIETKK